jgi:hypothetical protein
VAALAGDWKAARDMQLDLPEIGFCSSNLAYPGEDSDGGCCGPAPELVSTTSQGLATGISGGLLTIEATEPVATQSDCCN